MHFFIEQENRQRDGDGGHQQDEAGDFGDFVAAQEELPEDVGEADEQGLIGEDGADFDPVRVVEMQPALRDHDQAEHKDKWHGDAVDDGDEGGGVDVFQLAHADIAGGERHGGGHGDDEAPRVLADIGASECGEQAAEADQQADAGAPVDRFFEDQPAEQRGEEDLRLQQDRHRRGVEHFHRGEEQALMDDAHVNADFGDLPEAGLARPFHKGEEQQRREAKAQSDDDHRRQFGDADLDRNDIPAPDQNNEEAEEDITQFHGAAFGGF